MVLAILVPAAEIASTSLNLFLTGRSACQMLGKPLNTALEKVSLCSQITFSSMQITDMMANSFNLISKRNWLVCLLIHTGVGLFDIGKMLLDPKKMSLKELMIKASWRVGDAVAFLGVLPCTNEHAILCGAGELIKEISSVMNSVEMIQALRMQTKQAPSCCEEEKEKNSIEDDWIDVEEGAKESDYICAISHQPIVRIIVPRLTDAQLDKDPSLCDIMYDEETFIKWLDANPNQTPSKWPIHHLPLPIVLRTHTVFHRGLQNLIKKEQLEREERQNLILKHQDYKKILEESL